MQRLKKSATLRLKEILILFSFVCLSGCLAPKKPNVELCNIDYPSDEGICGMTEGGEVYRIELSDLDRGTAFSPEEWEKVKNYIDELTAYIERGCR